VKTSAASASRFPTKRTAAFIVFTAGMLSDRELFSDAEAFAGPLRDAARRCRKTAGEYACVWQSGKRLATLCLLIECGFVHPVRKTALLVEH
jgi:hypothetical protein